MPADYTALYRFQDEILNCIFSGDAPWYLTGGTALSRFHLKYRFSDDLDFFSTEPAWFTESFREIRETILKYWPQTEILVDVKDFKRLFVRYGSSSVKLDFICDRTPRIGRPELVGSWKIDTVRNIASNKVGTLIGRDEPRDAADLLEICRRRFFLWSDLIAEAQQKEHLTIEDLIYRCRTFPLDWLDKVPFFVPRIPETDRRDWETLINDLAVLGPNTLSEAGSPGL